MTKRVKLKPLKARDGKPFKIEGEILELPIDPERNVRYLVKLSAGVSGHDAQQVAQGFRELLGQDRVLIIMGGEIEIFELEPVDGH